MRFQHPVEQCLILVFECPERHIAILFEVGLHEGDFFIRKLEIKGCLVVLGCVETESDSKGERLHLHQRIEYGLN